MSTQPWLRLRLAQAADIPAIARLLAQLYHAELPGTLRGPYEGQLNLLRYTLERGSGTLFRRYVAEDTNHGVIALASLRLARDRVVATMPSGTTHRAISQIGWLNALRLLGTIVQGSLMAEATLGLHDAFLHSVVVDERLRGQGIGGWLLDQIERVAWEDGARTLQLRVISANTGAKRLYLRHGYRVISSTPRWLGWATVPSELLKKPLAPSP